MIPERGQIVWLDFNPQRGHEQAGRRPAVVISPKAYNAISNCVVVCPITSNLQPWPWKTELRSRTGISGAILVDQVKSIDTTARKMEVTRQFVDEETMQEALARLKTLTGT